MSAWCFTHKVFLLDGRVFFYIFTDAQICYYSYRIFLQKEHFFSTDMKHFSDTQMTKPFNGWAKSLIYSLALALCSSACVSKPPWLPSLYCNWFHSSCWLSGVSFYPSGSLNASGWGHCTWLQSILKLHFINRHVRILEYVSIWENMFHLNLCH